MSSVVYFPDPILPQKTTATPDFKHVFTTMMSSNIHERIFVLATELTPLIQEGLDEFKQEHNVKWDRVGDFQFKVSAQAPANVIREKDRHMKLEIRDGFSFICINPMYWEFRYFARDDQEHQTLSDQVLILKPRLEILSHVNPVEGVLMDSEDDPGQSLYQYVAGSMHNGLYTFALE